MDKAKKRVNNSCPYNWMTPHSESGWKSVVGPFCGKSQRAKAVGCFCGGAVSLMFDRILNVTLYEKVSTTRNAQGILNCPYLLMLLIHTKHKTRRWYQGKFIDLTDKAKNG